MAATNQMPMTAPTQSRTCATCKQATAADVRGRRQQLMLQLQQQSLAVDDIALYLDTHPTDETAMEYYRKFRNLRTETVQLYEENFGPLTNEWVDPQGCWNWVTDPWPWERQA